MYHIDYPSLGIAAPTLPRTKIQTASDDAVQNMRRSDLESSLEKNHFDKPQPKDSEQNVGRKFRSGYTNDFGIAREIGTCV